jgi:CHAT domain-containing protein
LTKIFTDFELSRIAWVWQSSSMASVVGRREFLSSVPSSLLWAYAAANAQVPAGQERAEEIFRQGITAAGASEYDRANELFSQALKLFRETLNRKRQAQCLSNLGMVEEWRHMPSEALNYLNEALTVWRDLKDREGLGGTLVHVALCKEQQGDLTAAIANFEEAITFLDGRLRSIALSKLGMDLSKAGRRREGIQRLIEAADVAKAAGAVLEEATGANGAGTLLMEDGDHAAAIPLLERAAPLWREQKNSEREAGSLYILGLAYGNAGRPADSRRTLSEALGVAKNASNHEQAASIASSIAQYHDALNEHDIADGYWRDATGFARASSNKRVLVEMMYGHAVSQRFRAQPDLNSAWEDLDKTLAEALRIAQEIQAPDFVAIIQNERGELRRDSGNIDDGLRMIGEAANAFHELGMIRRELYSCRAMGIGLLFAHAKGQLKDLSGLEPIEARMIRLTESWHDTAGPPGRTLLAIALNNLALVQEGRGRTEQALATLEKARALYEQLARPLEEATALGHIGTLLEQVRPAAAPAAYQRAIRLAEGAWKAARISELQTAYAGYYASIYQRAAAFYAGAGSLGQAFICSEQARARTLLVEVARQFQGGPSVSMQDVPVLLPAASQREREFLEERLRRKLADSPGGEYSPISIQETQEALDPDTTLLSYLIGPEKVLAFSISKDSAEVVLLPVWAGELNRLLGNLIIEGEPRRVNAQLQQLGQWLIAPIEAKLKTTRLAIVPHRGLHRVPFAALKDKQETWLCDRFSLYHLPSASILKLRGPAVQGPPRLLAASCAQTRLQSLPKLDFAESEATAVARIFGATPLTNPSKDEIRRRLAQANIALFSMHADRDRMYLEKEVIASGDIYQWDLRSFDLVMLSACRTAGSSATEGDELEGLTRAMLVAGARSVVASLWSLNDIAGSRIATGFFRNLMERGLSKEEALRRAQIEAREAASGEVAKWAPFVLVGQPGPCIASKKKREEIA